MQSIFMAGILSNKTMFRIIVDGPVTHREVHCLIQKLKIDEEILAAGFIQKSINLDILVGSLSGTTTFQLTVNGPYLTKEDIGWLIRKLRVDEEMLSEA